MKKLLLVLLALPMLGFGQNVNIPDVNFKAYLVGNTAINTNGDTEIQLSEAAAFNGTINCNNMNISNLIGIEAFTALDTLYCKNNQLDSLNLSQNTALTYLSCGYNQLTSLNVSQNTALTYLSCWNNQLDSLNVSQNTALTYLWCEQNQLTSLDLSQNTALTWLNCGSNQLTSLDVRNGNNTNFFIDGPEGLESPFIAYNNPNLYCIDVDDATSSICQYTIRNDFVDSQSYFSNNCGSK